MQAMSQGHHMTALACVLTYVLCPSAENGMCHILEPSHISHEHVCSYIPYPSMVPRCQGLGFHTRVMYQFYHMAHIHI